MGRFLTENASGMTPGAEPVAVASASPEPLAAENIEYLYRHLRYDLLFNAAGGVLVGAGLWHTAERWRLALWLCVLFAVLMGRALLRYRYLARGPDSSESRWLSPFTAWATATGLCWGGLCLVLAPNHDVASQVVALISNGTVQISAVACFSAYPRVLRYFVISASAPAVVYLLFLGDPAYLMAAVLASLYVAAILSAGANAWS